MWCWSSKSLDRGDVMVWAGITWAGITPYSGWQLDSSLQYYTEGCSNLVFKLFYANQWRHGPPHTKTSSGICWQRRSRSQSGQDQPGRPRQSDQGLHCPLKASLVTQNIWMESKGSMILCACAGWSDSARFANVRRHTFVWHGTKRVHSVSD